MFTVYDYMTPTTLAGVVAAARKMLNEGHYDGSQLMLAVNAGKALIANVGEEEAQAMIDTAMEAVETRYGIALMCVDCHETVGEIDLDAAEEAGVWY